MNKLSMNKLHTRIPSALAALCGLAAIMALPGLLLWSQDVTHSAAMPALFVLLWQMGKRSLAVKDKRLRRFSLVFGFAFALCQLAGYRLDAAGTVGGERTVLWLFVAALGCTPALGYLFAAFVKLCGQFSRRELDRGQPRKLSDGQVFWLAFTVICLCWLPYWLAYFPGMFNFDAAAQTAQFQSGYYNTVYPLVHTLFLKLCYELGAAMGSVNAGIAIYTGIQIVSLAASMAYAVVYLYRLGVVRGMTVGMLLIFALLPFHPLLAMSTTKDLFFSAALLMLMLRLHAHYHQERQGGWVSTALLCAAVCLLRTNGIAAVGAALVAGLWMLRKDGRWKHFAAAMLCGLVLFAGGNAVMKAAVKPAGTGIREGLSVPLMQVARAYALAQEKGETLPEEAQILEFIPDADRYMRHLSDGVKRHATVGVSNMPEFLKVWAAVGARDPAVYWDAFLYLNKAYWHIDDQTHLDIYAERGDHGYMETKAHEGYGVTRASLLPRLESELDRLYVDNAYRSIPVLATVLEPGFWCWLLWAVMALALYRRNWGAIFSSVMLLGLFATMMIGPCAYIRYAYPLALCALPLLGICLGDPSAQSIGRFDREQD